MGHFRPEDLKCHFFNSGLMANSNFVILVNISDKVKKFQFFYYYIFKDICD